MRALVWATLLFLILNQPLFAESSQTNRSPFNNSGNFTFTDGRIAVVTSNGKVIEAVNYSTKISIPYKLAF